MADPDTRAELNRLYWDSDASISEIADRLDISRRALYDGIEPLPAETACPECGGELAFRNRTALENREAECPECGHETRIEGVPRAADPEAAGVPTSPEDHPSARSRERPLPDMGSGPVLGTAFIAGMTVGAMLTYLLNKR